MSERINHDDMLQRVAAAREGWQVPGAYLVQAHDDAMALNRIADELVVERDQLRKRAVDAEAVLATIPMAPLLRLVEAILMGGQPLQFDLDAAERWLNSQPRV